MDANPFRAEDAETDNLVSFFSNDNDFLYDNGESNSLLEVAPLIAGNASGRRKCFSKPRSRLLPSKHLPHPSFGDGMGKGWDRFEPFAPVEEPAARQDTDTKEDWFLGTDVRSTEAVERELSVGTGSKGSSGARLRSFGEYIRRSAGSNGTTLSQERDGNSEQGTHKSSKSKSEGIERELSVESSDQVRDPSLVRLRNLGGFVGAFKGTPPLKTKKFTNPVYKQSSPTREERGGFPSPPGDDHVGAFRSVRLANDVDTLVAERTLSGPNSRYNADDVDTLVAERTLSGSNRSFRQLRGPTSNQIAGTKGPPLAGITESHPYPLVSTTHSAIPPDQFKSTESKQFVPIVPSRSESYGSAETAKIYPGRNLNSGLDPPELEMEPPSKRKSLTRRELLLRKQNAKKSGNKSGDETTVSSHSFEKGSVITAQSDNTSNRKKKKRDRRMFARRKSTVGAEKPVQDQATIKSTEVSDNTESSKPKSKPEEEKSRIKILGLVKRRSAVVGEATPSKQRSFTDLVRRRSQRGESKKQQEVIPKPTSPDVSRVSSTGTVKTRSTSWSAPEIATPPASSFRRQEAPRASSFRRQESQRQKQKSETQPVKDGQRSWGRKIRSLDTLFRKNRKRSDGPDVTTSLERDSETSSIFRIMGEDESHQTRGSTRNDRSNKSNQEPELGFLESFISSLFDYALDWDLESSDYSSDEDSESSVSESQGRFMQVFRDDDGASARACQMDPVSSNLGDLVVGAITRSGSWIYGEQETNTKRKTTLMN